MRKFLIGLVAWLWSAAALANVPCSVPFNLLNGTTADATQVMANYNALITCLTQAAAAGANNDITSLNALSTPISPTQGGSTIYVGGTSTGTANVQSVPVLTPSGFSLLAGKSVIFIAGLTNTGPMTLNIGTLGAKNVSVPTLFGPPTTSLIGGEMQAGQLMQAVYDGTNFLLLNASPTLQPTRTLTSAGSVANSDNHGKIILGGGAFFTLTFNAVGTYLDGQFWVDVVNSDSAGKFISLSGATNFYMYPLQSKRFFINNAGQWSYWPAFERYRKTGLQLFADIGAGNDANDCLAAGAGRACQHIAAAYARLVNDIDAQNSAPTINVAGGIYTENLAAAGQITGVNATNITASAPVTWKPSGVGPAVFSQDNAEIILSGPFTFDNSGGSSGAFATAVHQTGVLDFNNGFTFGNFANGTYAQCDHGGGSINFPASFTINGAVGTFLFLGGSCSATWAGGGTLTIGGGSTCATFISVVGSGANLAMGTVTVSGSENAGCSKYFVGLNGSLSAGGTSTAGWGGVGGTTDGFGVFSP